MLSKVALNQEAAKRGASPQPPSVGAVSAHTAMPPPPLPPKLHQTPASIKAAHRAAKKPVPKRQLQEEAAAQSGLELCHKLGEYCKVETTDFTMSPHDQTLWRVFGAYAKRARPSMLYSNARSVNMTGGRLLYAAICCKVGLRPPFNPSGCVLWNHQWTCDGPDPKVRCFHGDVMPRKENAVELTPSSEAGMTALRDGKGVLTTNRWGKQSVRVSQETAAVCANDAAQKFGVFGRTSCGMTFSDTNKARTAMRNAAATTEVSFPGAKASHLLFMAGHCECNYGGKSCLGRQVCKVTPFSMPGLENVLVQDVDALRAPFVRDPAVFVFQCCNFSASKRNNAQKSCDYKISHTDLLGALATARKLWMLTFNEPMPIRFDLLKWSPDLQVKNAAMPEVGVCTDPNPFGELPTVIGPPSSKLARKRQLKLASSTTPKEPPELVVVEDYGEVPDEDLVPASQDPSSTSAYESPPPLKRVAFARDEDDLAAYEDSQVLVDSDGDEI